MWTWRSGNRHGQQGRVLLRAEHVAVSWATAGAAAADGELDGSQVLELEERHDAVRLRTEQPGHGLLRQRPAVHVAAVGRGVGEEDVESDEVDAGVLGPECLGEGGETYGL